MTEINNIITQPDQENNQVRIYVYDSNQEQVNSHKLDQNQKAKKNKSKKSKKCRKSRKSKKCKKSKKRKKPKSVQKRIKLHEFDVNRLAFEVHPTNNSTKHHVSMTYAFDERIESSEIDNGKPVIFISQHLPICPKLSKQSNEFSKRAFFKIPEDNDIHKNIFCI